MNNLYISKNIDRQYNEQKKRNLKKKVEKVKNQSVHVLIDGSNGCFSGKWGKNQTTNTEIPTQTPGKVCYVELRIPHPTTVVLRHEGSLQELELQ